MQRSTVMAADLAATVVEPDEANGTVVFCLPGGGMSRHYFDLDGGDSDGTLSMAAHLAGQGFTVISIDHPGVRDSPAGCDGWELTPNYVADRDAAAIIELHQRHPGPAIGVGHSTGAMLTVIAQGRHRCYDALGLLGWSYSQRFGLPEMDAGLSDAERAVLGDADAIEEQLVWLTKQRFDDPRPPGSSAVWELLIGGMQISEQARTAISASTSELLAVCGLAAILRGAGPHVAAIDVPVFLGFGECDITGNARATAEEFGRSPDITLYELAAAGHNHNVAPNRSRLWNRFARWADDVDIDSNTKGPHQVSAATQSAQMDS
ncbi:MULTISPECIES: alpha/beta hydrolase [unclassified Mycobacterium]|uniref:alpha/beta hydrolase n=1 Tax=unclassified Mycobacterium TaxID=2642494 RepID=UPI0029C6BB06|nr:MULTISPECIES: alpha/beta hydrolase [unclassified Mycobacterium]